MGGRPHSGIQSQLRSLDQQLRAVCLLPRFLSSCFSIPCLLPFFGFLVASNQSQELAMVTDESIYNELQASDYNMGRWTAEDPSLRAVQRWLRARRR